MSPDDLALLRDYTDHGSQTAFATLVNRHLNLVYSVALRQVRSPQLAEEVAQSVFVDLARHAGRLRRDTHLAGWLHTTSRRAAIDVVRRESRRQAHEALAAQLDAMKTPSSEWTALEPFLDEAVESLGQADRTAILLRYFENKSLRDVGAALGISDDTAQKRVSRAVDQLRAFFVRRGIAVTAAGLATSLSAHALEAAPVGLGSTISTAALATSASASVMALETSRLVVMTTLQKSAAVLAFAAIGGFGLYETTVAARQTDQLAALRAQSERNAAEIRALRTTRATAIAQLNATEKQIDARLASALRRSPADAALEAQMQDWLGRLDKSKAALARYPQLNIPELALLSEEEWNNIAGGQALETERQIREVSSQLRHRAEGEAARRIGEALRGYLKIHPDTLPTRSQELAPYFDPPLDSAILDRWEVVQTGKLSALARGVQGKILAVKEPADVELDALYSVGVNSYGSTSAVGANLNAATRAFRQAHPDERATTAAQLKPYLKWPLSDETLEKWLSNSPQVRP